MYAVAYEEIILGLWQRQKQNGPEQTSLPRVSESNGRPSVAQVDKTNTEMETKAFNATTTKKKKKEEKKLHIYHAY